MDGFESIFTDILGVFSNYTIKVDFETIFTDFLGVFLNHGKSSQICAAPQDFAHFDG